MYFVYILHAPASDIYYTGQTDNLPLRLQFHNELSQNSFTSKHRPWVLKRSIPVESRSTAILIEKYIKGRKSKKFIERLIEDQEAIEKLLRRFNSAG